MSEGEEDGPIDYSQPVWRILIQHGQSGLETETETKPCSRQGYPL